MVIVMKKINEIIVRCVQWNWKKDGRTRKTGKKKMILKQNYWNLTEQIDYCSWRRWYLHKN